MEVDEQVCGCRIAVARQVRAALVAHFVIVIIRLDIIIVVIIIIIVIVVFFVIVRRDVQNGCCLVAVVVRIWWVVQHKLRAFVRRDCYQDCQQTWIRQIETHDSTN